MAVSILPETVEFNRNVAELACRSCERHIVVFSDEVEALDVCPFCQADQEELRLA